MTIFGTKTSIPAPAASERGILNLEHPNPGVKVDRHGTPEFEAGTGQAWALCTNDAWLGAPPGYWGGPDQAIQVAGTPPWWAELNRRGFKANGLGIMLEYPGGVAAYAQDFIRPHARRYLVGLHGKEHAKVTGKALSAWPDPIGTDPPADWVQAANEFRGVVVLDNEYNWPTASAFWTRNEALGDGHKTFRAVLDRLRGRPVTDAEYSSAYAAVADPFFGACVAEVRAAFPKVRGIGLYGWPADGPHLMYVDAATRLAIQASHDEPLAFKHFTVQVPSFYLHYVIVQDSIQPPDGAIRQTQWRKDRGPFADEVYRLKKTTGKAVVAFAWALHTGSAGNAAGMACDQMSASEMLALADAAQADYLAFWSPTFDAGFHPWQADQYSTFYRNNAPALKKWAAGRNPYPLPILGAQQ